MPGRAYTAMVKSISQPIASLTDIVMGSKGTSPIPCICPHSLTLVAVAWADMVIRVLTDLL